MKHNPLYADVLLPLATPAMSFLVPDHLREQIREGSRVVVPFGARKFYGGVVCRLHHDTPPFKRIKEVAQISEATPVASAEQLKLWSWISEYYLCPAGLVMRAALPSALKLDGFSAQEAFESGYRPTPLSHLRIHPSLHDEWRLSEALDSLRRAKAQQRAVMEYLQREECERKAQEDVKDVEGVENVKAKSEGAQAKRAQGANSGSHPPYSYLMPRKAFEASSTILKTLLEKELFEEVFLEVPPTLTERPTEQIREIDPDTLPQLSPTQAQALAQIKHAYDEQKKGVALLHGVTGSGKTELYIHLFGEVLAKGKNALLLLPEIALTTQLIERMESYFPARVVVYHSRLTPNRRAQIYSQLLNCSGGYILLGVRSSVLLPTPNLGLVVVDEEHDSSFKQSDTAPRYHGRDTAIVLAGLYGAKTLLGSATPSLESYYNALTGKYALVSLSERYSGVALPRVVISDTIRSAKRGERRAHFNGELLEALDRALSAEEQVIFFQNRRGFSPYIECADCGWSAQCPDCNVSLTLHKQDNTLRCHYCGHKVPMPSRCPSCGVGTPEPKGFGTEKIEEQLQALYPEAVIDRLDADSSRAQGSFQRIVKGFERGETDILVGTQMVTKGFDFGRVSLVGVLGADNLLNYPDFRAVERAFQLMMQVGGRAGRREQQGTVVIQTAQPKHPIFAHLISGDYATLARTQLAERQAFSYPPYVRLISLRLRHRNKRVLQEAATELARIARPLFGVRLLGPEAPPVDRIRGEYLLGFLLKIEREYSFAEAKVLLQKAIDRLHANPPYRYVEVIADVDPA